VSRRHRARRRHVVGPLRLAVALLLASAACASEGRPGLDWNTPPVPGGAGSATVGDVEVSASADAWRGWPRDLWRVVTPIHVVIDNRGAVPLRVLPGNFTLVVDGQRSLAATDPIDVRGVTDEPPPDSTGSRFGIPSPGYADWALQAGAPTGSGEPQPGEHFPLPTPEMLERALPEGVVEPGQSASGFVYFERPPARAAALALAFRLVNDQDGEPRGRIVVLLRPR
jgi:hypothetical protein